MNTNTNNFKNKNIGTNTYMQTMQSTNTYDFEY